MMLAGKTVVISSDWRNGHCASIASGVLPLSGKDKCRRCVKRADPKLESSAWLSRLDMATFVAHHIHYDV